MSAVVLRGKTSNKQSFYIPQGDSYGYDAAVCGLRGLSITRVAEDLPQLFLDLIFVVQTVLT